MSFDALLQFDWQVLALISAAAFVTSLIHGATGIAGGMLMAAVLAMVIGVKPVVPVISVALLISHSARALLNFRKFDLQVFLLVSASALPGLLLVSFLYGRLSATWIGTVLGCVLLLSIPIKRYGTKTDFQLGPKGLGGASAVYGLLSGASVGAGMVLSPFMLAFGMGREAFVATMAVVALTTNVVRVGVYGGTDQLMGAYLLLGVAVGVLTIPGNWLGRTLLRRMSDRSHSGVIEVLTVLAAGNFFYLAWR